MAQDPLTVRFWGTRGSVPTPGAQTAKYGGNTSCVEMRAQDGTIIVLDCGTGARLLGLDLLKSASRPLRINLFIGHTHWDHIQGFPFFTPAFLPDTELNVFAPAGLQRTIQDALAGQMQYSYFPVTLRDLRSRIHFTELEEGFFRLGDIMVETQHLNHTAPTISFRISSGGATDTVPVKIYSATRAAPLPSTNAIATIMMLLTLASVTLGFLVWRAFTRGERRAGQSVVKDMGALEI